MPVSGFVGIETALRGLLAEQQALDVTGHNIANANTVGYSRQQIVLTPTTPYSEPPAGQIGTGVEVTAYERVRNLFLDTQYRAQNAQQGAADALQDGLSQVEDAFAEPSDNGLNALLGKYWSAWQDVATSPDDPATRQSLVQTAKTLTDGINGLAGQLDTLTTQIGTQQLPLAVQQVDSIATQIARLNGQIDAAETVSGSQNGVYQKPNDLLDQRDALLDQLSQLTQVSVAGPAKDAKDGEITVSIGTEGVALVSGADPSPNALVLNPDGTFEVDDANGGLVGTVGFGTSADSAYRGQLGGLQHLLELIGDYRSQLDTVAQQLALQTNGAHSGGADVAGDPVAGTAYESFFVAARAGGALDAANITVNPALLADPSHVAAAAPGSGPGDNTVALRIADLPTTVPASTNVGDLYTSLVTTLGTDSQQATQTASVSKTLTDAVDSRRKSVSGVSLDEEMTNLVRFQRGYQAAARALTAMDDMLDQLINRTGKVGL